MRDLGSQQETDWDPADLDVYSLFGRVAKIGAQAGDSSAVSLQKTLLVLSTLMMAILAVIWGAVYWLFDEPTAASIPWAYAVISFMSIAVFATAKRYGFFRFSQLLLSLFLPFFLMISLRGFTASSAVVMWSLTSPLGALLFADKRQAIWWFAAFLGLVLLGAISEVVLPSTGNNLPPVMVRVFFVMNIAMSSVVVFVLTTYFVFGKETALDQVKVERARSDGLLANILPDAIAKRLIAHDRPIADRFENVTILFADIVGFTEFSNARSPEEVVALLDDLFSTFDDLADAHGLEKIKTIGDAYMAAAGLPEPRPDHAAAMADFALEALARFKANDYGSTFGLSMRFGIHSGSVVAGIIGKRKFSYDVWGDTVNHAARLEAAAAPNCILLSSDTRSLLGDGFQFGNLGLIDLKGIGREETYSLEARSAET